MTKPNIIIIVLDALRAQNLGIYGYHIETAPFLSRLSRKGVVFTNAYATTDQTDPSFTTILSGRYPLVHGIIRHGPDLTEREIKTFNATGTKLLQEFLKENNYVTIAIDWLGRWHKRGFDIYASPSELYGKKPLTSPQKISSSIMKLLTHTPNWSTYEKLYHILSRLGYYYDKSALSVFKAATRLLEENIRNLKKPFFMLIHLWDTHTPLHDIPLFLVREFYDGKCSETVKDMAKRIKSKAWRELVLEYHLKGICCVDEVEPRYNAAIRHVDKALFNFITYLEERRLLENTYIVLTSDHGENLIRNGIFIGHGGLFQRVLRVPLIILGPEIPQGKKVETPVQHVDIAPTLLHLVKAETPSNYYFDGRNMLETLETGETLRDYVFAVSSTARKRYAIIEDEIKYVYSPSLEDAMDKYGGIWFNNVEELYDLRVDQDDSYNLVYDKPDIAKEMRAKLISIEKRLIRTRLRLILIVKT